MKTYIILIIALTVCTTCNHEHKDKKSTALSPIDSTQKVDVKTKVDKGNSTTLSGEKQFMQTHIPIDTFITHYSESNALYTYIYKRYDSLVGRPIRSFAVKNARDSLLLWNNGDSLFLEDDGPDEEHVTIYPIFSINNKEHLEITVTFRFLPEISCAYTKNLVYRLNLHRPYSDEFEPFMKYSFVYINSKINILRSFLFEPYNKYPINIDTIYKNYIFLKSKGFLPVEKKDKLYLDLYDAVLIGDTNKTYEIIYNYNNKFDPSDVEYQLTRYLTSFCQSTSY